MRAVVQRVKESSVTVDGRIAGEIGRGLLILLGVQEEDTPADVEYMAEKIVHLRVFEDGQDKMNLSVKDVGGGVLVISQFTLLGDCRKGRRPSYGHAARPELAQELYARFITRMREYEVPVSEGVFQAMMDVHLINDGPVTLLLDSRRTF
jgi:D-tyrosyl-tRNA(Tyr) deacylase